MQLPSPVEVLLGEWQLVVDGPLVHARRAVVLPVRTPGHAPAVLKVGPAIGPVDADRGPDPDPEPGREHEHLALQHWHGHGAVLLLRADPRRAALLLERAYGEDLADRWDLEACEIVGGLYRRLHRPAPPQLRRLSEFVEGWMVRLGALPRSAPVPRRLVEQAVGLGRQLASDPASTGTMIHTDLRYENVLAAGRQPWLAIAPKPLNGDPHFEPGPMLWHRWSELVEAGDVRAGVRRRFHTLVDTAELDEDRARDWTVVRCLVNVLCELETGAPDRDLLTRYLAVAKAVQD